MWRRSSSRLQMLAASWWSTSPHLRCPAAQALRTTTSSSLHPSTLSPSSFEKTLPLFSSNSDEDSLKKKMEDVMPIATGHEREELEAEIEGRKRFDMDAPVGPFGTKVAPAIIQSYYDKRLVGCPGGEGEDEHDVVWFWLEKGKPQECPVCSQYFLLEVIGAGGSPDGHGDDHHH
ncbi:putative cytochrome-c oxidase [Dioscorea sansibarensis]